MSFKMRFGLWLLAWLAVGIPTAYSVMGSIAGVPMAPVFPGGFAYLADSPDVYSRTLALFGGWVIYIAFTIFLLRPRAWGTYLVFYVLLVVLLIANGVGCSRQSRTIKLTRVPQPIGHVLRSA
jgi:hypothetical protein